MSRSYKKFPVVKDRASTSKNRQKPKTFANRTVRRSKIIPSGKAGFKKLYCSWNICDYRFLSRYSNEKFLKKAWDNGDMYIHVARWGDFRERFQSYEEALQDWKRCYVRK
ncbi:MAG: hypothetical protein HDT22_03240 [Ruminococcus sp.]|nr:hypothetical protein [Ruminococcus sp.]